jgi:hypothetical protein
MSAKGLTRVVPVLNVVFGCLSLLGCSGSLLIWTAEVWARPLVGLPPSYSKVLLSYFGASLALAVVLVIAGIGLTRRHRWAWLLSGVYALGTLALNLALFLYLALLCDQPAVESAVRSAIASSYAVFLLATFPFIAAKSDAIPNRG